MRQDHGEIVHVGGIVAVDAVEHIDIDVDLGGKVRLCGVFFRLLFNRRVGNSLFDVPDLQRKGQVGFRTITDVWASFQQLNCRLDLEEIGYAELLETSLLGVDIGTGRPTWVVVRVFVFDRVDIGFLLLFFRHSWQILPQESKNLGYS